MSLDRLSPLPLALLLLGLSGCPSGSDDDDATSDDDDTTADDDDTTADDDDTTADDDDSTADDDDSTADDDDTTADDDDSGDDDDDDDDDVVGPVTPLAGWYSQSNYTDNLVGFCPGSVELTQFQIEESAGAFSFALYNEFPPNTLAPTGSIPCTHNVNTLTCVVEIVVDAASLSMGIVAEFSDPQTASFTMTYAEVQNSVPTCTRTTTFDGTLFADPALACGASTLPTWPTNQTYSTAQNYLAMQMDGPTLSLDNQLGFISLFDEMVNGASATDGTDWWNAVLPELGMTWLDVNTNNTVTAQDYWNTSRALVIGLPDAAVETPIYNRGSFQNYAFYGDVNHFYPSYGWVEIEVLDAALNGLAGATVSLGAPHGAAFQIGMGQGAGSQDFALIESPLAETSLADSSNPRPNTVFFQNVCPGAVPITVTSPTGAVCGMGPAGNPGAGGLLPVMADRLTKAHFVCP